MKEGRDNMLVKQTFTKMEIAQYLNYGKNITVN